MWGIGPDLHLDRTDGELVGPSRSWKRSSPLEVGHVDREERGLHHGGQGLLQASHPSWAGP